MKLEILSRETIKPSSPTPSHLKIHNLSLFDQIAPYMYIPLVFFYHRQNNGGFHSYGGGDGVGGDNLRQIEEFDINWLKKSLSRALTRYYPFAGRIKDEVSIDCNDDGVIFSEAKLHSLNLSEILQNPTNEILDLLFVDALSWRNPDPNSGSLLAVQVTFFDCGGFAIGVLLSHKLADGATIVKFVNDWALISRQKFNIGEEEEEELKNVNPLFNSAALFPNGGLRPMSSAVIEEGNTVICKRFIFNASKIESLKRIVSEKVKNPTRVEVVTALIYRAIVSICSDKLTHMISSSSSSSLQAQASTILLQTINLRTRVKPPVPESLVGSLVSFFPVNSDGGDELDELLGSMRENMAEFCRKYAEKYRSEELNCVMKKRFEETREKLGNRRIYRCTSVCRFGIYEVDFGWGKPEWATMAGFRMKNTVLMHDGKNGDGIEALVSLEEKEMAEFEKNDELLAFASLYPTA